MAKPVVAQNPYNLHSVQMDELFGRYGSTYSNNTVLRTAPANFYFYRIEITADGTGFTTLTPLVGSTCLDDGVPKTGILFPLGFILYGVYQSFQLSSGAANAYKAPVTNWENWYQGIQRQGD